MSFGFYRRIRKSWGQVFILGVSPPCVPVGNPRPRIAPTPSRCSYSIGEEMGLADADAGRL